MTQLQFAKLPFLLTRKQFLAVTGITGYQLAAMCDAGDIRTYRPPRRNYRRKGTLNQAKASYSRYYKADAARIAGLVL